MAFVELPMERSANHLWILRAGIDQGTQMLTGKPGIDVLEEKHIAARYLGTQVHLASTARLWTMNEPSTMRSRQFPATRIVSGIRNDQFQSRTFLQASELFQGLS